MTLTPETIAALAGSLLSLLFSYVPGLRSKFSDLDSTRQSLVMAGLLLVVAAGALAWGCRAAPGFGACLGGQWETALSAYVAALGANQATYLISPKPAKKN